ncbi:MAG: hypothetical protein ACTSVW_00495 [Candidatus Njordarchaeales archaeon]
MSSPPRPLVNRLVAYALSRERSRKIVERTWYLSKEDLLSEKFSTLNNFICNNIATIFNLYEVSMLTSEIREIPRLRISGSFGRIRRSKAYICEFFKDRSRELLNRIRTCEKDEDFRREANILAEDFRRTLFWPKCYLFIVQFSLTSVLKENFLAVLTTKLTHGALAENPEKIIEQLKKRLIDEKVKKGMIFPHIIQKDDKLTTEYKAKVYEDNPKPAQYFYNFLGLFPPQSPQEVVSEYYQELDKPSFEDFIKYLKKKDPRLPNLGKVKLIIDDLEIETTLANLRKFLFAKLRTNKFITVIKCSKVMAIIDNNDLIKDGSVRLLNEDELKRILF